MRVEETANWAQQGWETEARIGVVGPWREWKREDVKKGSSGLRLWS